MSASISPTLRPRACRATARLAATVDLPTPPLPLATASRCLTPGRESFWPGICEGGGIGVSRWHAGRALRAEGFQLVEGVNAAAVAVVPSDLVGVVPDGGHRHGVR